jgi:UDP-N-acetylmuramate--alanine ligase
MSMTVGISLMHSCRANRNQSNTVRTMPQKHIHIIGIGGIGISALAQLYVHQGYRVSGTNDSESPQTLNRIRALGVPIVVDTDMGCVPHDVDFFVYSDAWTGRHPEFMSAVRALGKPVYSYFEALGIATREGVSVVVTGTHGKTTTTAMIAKALVDLGEDPTVICGSIMAEFGSNFRAGRPDLFVIEGCEYMRHFLHLHPHILTINNLELDHTDYFKDLADVQDAFRTIASRVPESGVVITNTELPAVRPVVKDVSARVVPYQHSAVPALRVPGAFNHANAQTAKATVLAVCPHADEAVLDRSLSEFRGTWRRFEYKGVTKEGMIVYDDYAHHPSAVEVTLTMAREAFPDKRIVVVFHPHLFSRTRDFMDAFASALAHADEVLLAPIYPAREEPIEGVTSEVLAEKIVALGTSARAFESLDAILEHLTLNSKLQSQNVLITMGAGDVYVVADALTTYK